MTKLPEFNNEMKNELEKIQETENSITVSVSVPLNLHGKLWEGYAKKRTKLGKEYFFKDYILDVLTDAMISGEEK